MSLRDLPAFTVETRPGMKSTINERVAARWNPQLMGAGDADRSISILDPIGADFFGDGVTAKRIAAALRGMGPGPVVVNINSPGGDFFEGLAIYNALREHDGAVEVRILGLAASAASIIAMAGDEIKIGRAAFLMIHNTWVLAAGDRHAMREVADWLEPFDRAAANLYAVRTGKSAKNVGELLDTETWLGGQDAIDQGFADSLLATDATGTRAEARLELTAQAAARKLDAFLAGRVSRAQARALRAALRSGTPSAADTGMPDAANLEATARAALATLDTL